MGDTQSAQLAGKKDAEEEEESAKVNDVQTVQDTEDKVTYPKSPKFFLYGCINFATRI